jgi:hypothetical protein
MTRLAEGLVGRADRLHFWTLTSALRSATIDAMPGASWQLEWLRLHLAARELLATSPASPDWPEVKRELVRCAELRRALIAAGWFN